MIVFRALFLTVLISFLFFFFFEENVVYRAQQLLATRNHIRVE
jgi:hypothetical protein